MQFFKYKGLTSCEAWAQENDNRRVMREKTTKISLKSDTFNQKLQREAFFFVADVSQDIVTIGVISRDSRYLQKQLVGYLKAIEMELQDACLEEITFSTIRNMLLQAERREYISGDDEVLEQFDLDKINRRFGRECSFEEALIEDASKSKIYEAANQLLSHQSLISELDRIYVGKKMTNVIGHPVHYIIQTDDAEIRKNMCQVLLQALYARQRLRNKRYCFLELKAEETPSKTFYDGLYKSCFGGAMIIKYMVNDDVEDDHAACDRETIEVLCEAMKKYHNQVLTFFCLPRECAHTKALFYEGVGNTSFVELKEDLVTAEQAVCFLKKLASKHGTRGDKNLFSKLEPDKGYLTPELRDLFNDWYDCKLKTRIYPQYQEVHTVKQEVVKAAPKGSAYDQLMKMIGLEEAKKVIRQALNYYKAQKLFADKGMKEDRPAMHMVFTGNPGTAKTTVARLFARIMRENELLSKGNLVEVGRGDLVGKFVGWTAPTIQRRFREAEGGVLFIDEAYSLVDDRSGSYGDEAINTIVQEMENHREDVVVIFAGYPDLMETFLKKNPGLRSRIAFHIPFADYSVHELGQIADLMASQKGLKLTEEAQRKLTTIFETMRNTEDFGNGRFVRNVIEKAKLCQASRLLETDLDQITREDVMTLCAEDIEMPVTSESPKRKIGF